MSYAYNPFNDLPTSFMVNSAQTTAIVADIYSCKHYNLSSKKFIDLENKYGIDLVQALYYEQEDKSFYILHNRFGEAHGVYLFKFREEKPDESKYILKVRNMLKIDDASVSIIRDDFNHHKDLIVAYKTIYLNTYTIKVIYLANEE